MSIRPTYEELEQRVRELESSNARGVGRYSNLVELNPDPTVIVQDGYHKLINKAFTGLFGYTQDDVDKGLSTFELIQEKDKEKIAGRMNDRLAGKLVPPKYERIGLVAKDGKIIPCDISGVTISFNGKPADMAIIHDIREQLRAEEERMCLKAQLLQTQKMEALGTLAGGIAHEFNNILGIIIGNTELAMDEVNGWNPAHNNLTEIFTASLRARDLVKQILAFSRQTRTEQKPVRLNMIIQGSLKLIRSSVPSTIEIRRHILCGSDIVRADASQLSQVLINLCTNAVHAMGEKGGILEVSLEDVELTDEGARQDQDLPPGRYARLAVSDTGHGMRPDVMGRVFDPFFTTKEVGKGTGMGLAVVHGIIKEHGGDIAVYSEPGKGTTFHVLLPVMEEQVRPDIESKAPLKGRERILFVDDEESLVFASRLNLEELGYQVVGETNSAEALEAFRQEPANFDIVITDMAMPQMSGAKLGKELMKIRPDIPIILCTGFSEQINEDTARQMGIRAYIMKPYLASELTAAIRQVIGEADNTKKSL